MGPKVLIAATLIGALAMITIAPLVFATSNCPASQPYFGPYTKVTILPMGYKLVNQTFTVNVVRVDSGSEKAVAGNTVSIYLTNGTKKSLLTTGSTNSRGAFEYKPTKLGKYLVEAGGKSVTFDVFMKYDSPSDFGAVCGDGVCDKDRLENKTNCLADCAVCGDTVCDAPWEDKQSCPDDCEICGDNVCDESEVSATKIYCEQDCMKCGDGICRAEYGEVCPQDCGGGSTGKPVKDLLQEYWWAIGCAVIIVLLVFFKKEGFNISRNSDDENGPPQKTKGKKPAKKKGKEEEIDDIIKDLIDAGISDRKIISKLGEFGVSESQAEKMIARARRYVG